MTTIKVNITTHNENLGDFNDWAEIEITQELKDAVACLHHYVTQANAHRIERFDASPVQHWMRSPSTDNERLVVNDLGEFWWVGQYKHDMYGTCFSTQRMSLADLDTTEDLDKREYVEEEYPDEEDEA